MISLADRRKSLGLSQVQLAAVCNSYCIKNDIGLSFHPSTISSIETGRLNGSNLTIVEEVLQDLRREKAKAETVRKSTEFNGSKRDLQFLLSKMLDISGAKLIGDILFLCGADPVEASQCYGTRHCLGIETNKAVYIEAAKKLHKDKTGNIYLARRGDIFKLSKPALGINSETKDKEFYAFEGFDIDLCGGLDNKRIDNILDLVSLWWNDYDYLWVRTTAYAGRFTTREETRERQYKLIECLSSMARETQAVIVDYIGQKDSPMCISQFVGRRE